MIIYALLKSIQSHAILVHILDTFHNVDYHDYKIYMITVVLYLCKLILYDHVPYMYWIFFVYFYVYCVCYMYVVHF